MAAIVLFSCNQMAQETKYKTEKEVMVDKT